jgi:2,4-dichlorophenol 6-monooxygenase
MVVNLAQNRLEPILHERLQQLGGAVHFNATMVSAHSGDTSASLTIMDPVGQETTVTADYVVACDGAGSAVRRGLGIEMMGPSSLQILTGCWAGDTGRCIGLSGLMCVRS